MPGEYDPGADVLATIEANGLDLATIDAAHPPRLPGIADLKIGDRRWAVAAAKKARFLDLFAVNFDLNGCIEAVGWKIGTYRYHRQQDKRWAAEIDAIRGSSNGRPTLKKQLAAHKRSIERLVNSTGRGTAEHPPLPPDIADQGDADWQGFAGFRRLFFGMASPWFHIKIVNILESAKPGSVTLVLVGPLHGKTTLLTDWICFRLAVDPTYRVVYASEKQQHARKVIKRIKTRMTDPKSAYATRFGPFEPQLGEDAHIQPWAADYFDVWRRGVFDEQDYSMVGLGFGSAVAGTRCDLLVLDDVQSLKSLNQTEQILDEFRQDWLTRPSEEGRTVILGTRVGERDFYERVMEEGIVDHVVKFPAIEPSTGKLLWPERYSQENYDRMRKKVGESAWARNYQQQPTASGDRTFTEEDLREAGDPLLKVGVKPEHLPIRSAIVGHDPGFGTNAVFVAGVLPDRFVALDWRTDRGLTSTAQMAQILDDTMSHWSRQGVRIDHLVIEDKYLGTGLLTDEAFTELARKHGCVLSGHRTGNNKIDDDLGVAAMARSFRSREIVLPNADEEHTQRYRAMLDAELHAWRPGISGTKLRQDLVMAPLDVMTPVWTTSGFKRLDAVESGDLVATPSGDLAAVVGRTAIHRAPVWKVTLSDGSSLRATAGHRWWVEPLAKRGGRGLNGEWMTTEELISRRSEFKRLRLCRPQPFDPPAADLPVDPYVLGVWLGDGDARQPTIYGHDDDTPYIRAEFEMAGVPTTDQKRSMCFGTRGIRGGLVALGVLGNKHVPEAYLLGSFKQRLALLQGLMDTDGSVHNTGRLGGRCMFGNTNKALVDAVEFLALSLGFRPDVQSYPAGWGVMPGGDESNTQPFWRVLFTTHSVLPTPFRLPRKAERCNAEAGRVWTHLTIRSVEPDGHAFVSCLVVDHPSHQFLAGRRLVPTGNCWFAWVRWRTARMSAGEDDRSHIIRTQGLGPMTPLPFRPVVNPTSGLLVGSK